jgi:hypothetical protein
MGGLAKAGSPITICALLVVFGDEALRIAVNVAKLPSVPRQDLALLRNRDHESGGNAERLLVIAG